MGHTPGTAEEARRRPIDLAAVPADLKPLFDRLLVYDWRQRVQSAGDALALLDEPLTERLAAAPAATDTTAVEPPRRRRRPLYVAAAALVLLLALGWWWHSLPPPLAQPGLPVTVMASGLRYQDISRGDGAVRAPRHGYADVTMEARQADGRIAEAEHRMTVRVDDPSVAVGEVLSLMSRGAHWRIWSPAASGPDGRAQRSDVMVYDVTLNEVGAAVGTAPPPVAGADSGLRLANPDRAPGPPPRPAPARAATTLPPSVPTPPRPTPSARGPVCAVIPAPVFFDWDSAVLTPEAVATLDDAARGYRSCSGATVTLVGVIEGAPTRYAGAMAMRRAQSVAVYLEGVGVPAALVRTRVMLPRQPAVAIADGVREPADRRVEVRFGLP